MNDDRDDMQEYAFANQPDLLDTQDELDLPPHKRTGYAERIYEAADDLRKRMREEAP